MIGACFVYTPFSPFVWVLFSHQMKLYCTVRPASPFSLWFVYRLTLDEYQVLGPFSIPWFEIKRRNYPCHLFSCLHSIKCGMMILCSSQTNVLQFTWFGLVLRIRTPGNVKQVQHETTVICIKSSPNKTQRDASNWQKNKYNNEKGFQNKTAK